jgi:hypothetical protein
MHLKPSKLFVEKYPWFFLPAGVQKILIHGTEFINLAMVPIG